MQYRRDCCPGGTWFFTVTLQNRQSDLLVQRVDVLREVMDQVKSRHPFSMIAGVVLPEHLHVIWRLPDGDSDYAKRWSLIKSGFSRQIYKSEMITSSRKRKRERGIWQRRYWEHRIRDDNDLARHIDYIHFNPVKHGYVDRAADWPHSTLHEYINRGMLPENWGKGITPISDLSVGE